MSTYLVRLSNSHRLVGVFAAKTVTQLFLMIDDVFDPKGCEFLKMKSEEGVFLDALFTQEPEEHDAPSPVSASDELPALYAYLRAAPELGPIPTQMTEPLSLRLDEGARWMPFSECAFAEALGLINVGACGLRDARN